MGLLFASLSSLLYVALDVLRKLLGEQLAAPLIAMALLGGALPVYVGTLLITGPGMWDGTFVMVATLLAGLQALASVLYIQAVTLSPFSLTIPYLSFTPVVSAVVALVLLHEVPQWVGVIGIVLVAGGAVALQVEGQVRLRALLWAPFAEPGSWRMLLVAVLWGVAGPLSKIAIAHGSEALLACWIAGGGVLLLGLWWKISRAEEAQGKAPFSLRTLFLLVLAAFVVGGAVLCEFFAYREVLVAYVETIKRFGSLLTVLIGVLMFGEEGFSRRLPAAAVMTLGVVCLVWQ